MARLSLINTCLSSLDQIQVTKIGDTELNKILLNSIPNGWIMQAYVQVFYCQCITFKTLVNMFERMKIVEAKIRPMFFLTLYCNTPSKCNIERYLFGNAKM